MLVNCDCGHEFEPKIEYSHKLICGDCTDAEVVERLMDGEKTGMVFTDPPYAIYGSSTGVKNDANMIVPFFREVWSFIRSVYPHDIYMCCDWRSYPIIEKTISGFVIKDVIIWDKGSGGLGNPYRRRHEFLLFARRAQHDVKMFGQGGAGEMSITDDDVWQFPRVENKSHGAEKPVELVERAVINSSEIGHSVTDPFLGSGTTLIACERLNRKCRAVEISPAYVAVALERWAEMTGKEPELLE